MSRKRKAIPLQTQLAAALACLLPQDQRDALRRAKVPAKDVIRLFSPDHIGLHCFEAPDRDEWHNITPMLRPEHKEKSKADTSRAAKVKRLMARHAPAEVAGETSRPGGKKARPKHRWPSRPIPSRPFRPRPSP